MREIGILTFITEVASEAPRAGTGVFSAEITSGYAGSSILAQVAITGIHLWQRGTRETHKGFT